MRSYWIAFFLSILCSLALLVVIVGQYQVLCILNAKLEKQDHVFEKLYNDYASEELFAITLGNLVNQGGRAMRDLQGAMGKLNTELLAMEKENDACQKGKKTNNEQEVNKEKELSKMKDTVKAESDAWKNKIKTLNAQLTQNSALCIYARRNKQSEKLCDFTTIKSTRV